MGNGFVDREPEMRRMQNEIVPSDVHRLGGQLLHRLFRPARRVRRTRFRYVLVAAAARRDFVCGARLKIGVVSLKTAVMFTLGEER